MDDVKQSDRYTLGMSALSRLLADIGEKQLFFIGGPPKSGTTWIQLLLDKHPEVACAGETHFLDWLAPQMGKPIDDHRGYVEWMNDSIFTDLNCCPTLGNDDLVAILQVTMALLLRTHMGEKKVKALGEKTPDNISHLSMMNRLFPKSKFIHMVRDGRDCAVSGWFHNERLTRNWRTLHPIAEYARTFAEAWAEGLKIGDAFAEASPGRYHRVKYEDLSACPQETLRSVFDFLGVDSDEAVIDACIDAASFESLSGGRRRGQEDSKSFFRKGSCGDWKNHFDREAEQAFTDVAGDWMRRLGYE